MKHSVQNCNCRLKDVEVLVHMARRRCMDEKAAVRKAGLQLLEALLMMRAQGAGGVDIELPTEQDMRALEAATADALVPWLLLTPAILLCVLAMCTWQRCQPLRIPAWKAQTSVTS